MWVRILIVITLSVVTAQAIGTPPRRVIPKKQPVERSSAVKLLGIARDKLSNEAARLQIQGKGLSKKEITRLNTLYKSVGRIKEIISSLESSSLEQPAPGKSTRHGSSKTGSLRKQP